MTAISRSWRRKKETKARLLSYLKEQESLRTPTQAQTSLANRLMRALRLLRIELLAKRKRLAVKMRELKTR